LNKKLKDFWKFRNMQKLFELIDEEVTLIDRNYELYKGKIVYSNGEFYLKKNGEKRKINSGDIIYYETIEGDGFEFKIVPRCIFL
jgi:hypothetical protein